jgi:hypothetical protein
MMQGWRPRPEAQASPGTAGMSTPPNAPQLCAEDVRLLTQAGFLASGQGDVGRARRIFNGLALARPGRAFHAVGLALAFLNAARTAEAVQVLAQAEAANADERETLDAWRGLALQLDGRADESRRLLRAVADAPQPAGTPDSESRLLARRLLGDAPPASTMANITGGTTGGITAPAGDAFSSLQGLHRAASFR